MQSCQKNRRKASTVINYDNECYLAASVFDVFGVRQVTELDSSSLNQGCKACDKQAVVWTSRVAPRDRASRAEVV